jgi:hypothetical protein
MQEAAMQNRNSEDAVFQACATGTVIAAAAVYAALLYELFTVGAALLDAFLRSADLAARSL